MKPGTKVRLKPDIIPDIICQENLVIGEEYPFPGGPVYSLYDTVKKVYHSWFRADQLIEVTE